MRAASEGRDTHMLKQPGHFTSMKKEFGDCTRRFSLWRFSSSSRGGCSRSISPIEMPACESRERARGLSAKSERYERRPQAGQRSANAEESPAAVAAVQRQICRRSASDGVGAAKRWYHYQLRADHRRAARAGHPSATRTMVAAAVNSASDVQDDRVARKWKVSWNRIFTDKVFISTSSDTSVSQSVISRSHPALTPPPARSPAPPLPV